MRATHVCQICGKQYDRLAKLKIHLTSHTGEKLFKCTYEGCTKEFRTGYHLRRHTQFVHSDEEKPFHCSTCGKAFHQQYDLRKHDLVHQKVQTFVCPACGDAFVSTNLRNHFLHDHIGMLDSLRAEVISILELSKPSSQDSAAMQGGQHPHKQLNRSANTCTLRLSQTGDQLDFLRVSQLRSLLSQIVMSAQPCVARCLLGYYHSGQTPADLGASLPKDNLKATPLETDVFSDAGFKSPTNFSENGESASVTPCEAALRISIKNTSLAPTSDAPSTLIEMTQLDIAKIFRRCPICFASFTFLSELVEHTRRVHHCIFQDSIQCSANIDSEALEENLINEPNEVDTKVIQPNAGIAQNRDPSEVTLQDHASKRLQGISICSSFLCPLCGKSFSRKSNRTTHMKKCNATHSTSQ